MTKPLRVDGADISHFQGGTLDLAAFKRAGGKFLYHKATEGTSFTDDRYADRRAEAARAGLPFGAYHFARPDGGDAVDEARAFLTAATPKPGDLFPMLDLEDDGNLSRAALTEWARLWRAEVRKATGVSPIIYTPFDLDDDLGCMLWVARYSDNNTAPRVPAPWKQWDIRQFSDGILGVPDHVAGLGNVDLDQMRDGLTVADFTIPAVVAKPSRIRLQHSATQAQDTEAQFTHDAAVTLARDSHVIHFTEILSRKTALTAACVEAGYTLFDPQPSSDSGFALRDDLHCIAVGSRSGVVAGGKRRDVEWIRFELDGNTITYDGAHFLTRYGKSDRRHKMGLAMWDALATQVEADGADTDIVFWGIDANWDPDDASDNQPAQIMADRGLLSIFDELGVDVSTLGSRTPDLLGRSVHDQRVSAAWVKVHDPKAEGMFKDHADIVAAYDIEPLPT